MPRESLLQQIAHQVADIYPHVKQLYGELSSLTYVTSKRLQVLSSSEGVYQGDPLGPALFSATIHPVLCEVLTRPDEATRLAYLNDVYVVGPTESFNQFLKISNLLS